MSFATAMFDTLILDECPTKALDAAIDYLVARRDDYTALLAQSPVKIESALILNPVVVISLLDIKPGQRVSVAICHNRIELIVDERYGSCEWEYTTEVYIIDDIRQAFAWFLAAYW